MLKLTNLNKPMNYHRWLQLIILSRSDAVYTMNIPGERASQNDTS